MKYNKETNRNVITSDTDMLIVILTNEDDFNYKQIALFLNKDEKIIFNRLNEIRNNGLFNEIHETLMVFSDIYKRKMKQKEDI